jgi:hypothetical protein
VKHNPLISKPIFDVAEFSLEHLEHSDKMVFWRRPGPARRLGNHYDIGDLVAPTPLSGEVFYALMAERGMIPGAVIPREMRRQQ